MHRTSIAALTVLFLLTNCGDDPYCEIDSECSKNQFCNDLQNACEPRDIDKTCSNHDDCGFTSVCVEGACMVTECDSDSQCLPHGALCNESRSRCFKSDCSPGTEMLDCNFPTERCHPTLLTCQELDCLDDSECKSGETCNENFRCIECTGENEGCDMGEMCHRGSCVNCIDNDDCGANETCNNDFQCVFNGQCRADEDCNPAQNSTHAGRFCENFQCVECRNENNDQIEGCSENQFCIQNACVDCTENVHCRLGEICNPDTHRCKGDTSIPCNDEDISQDNDSYLVCAQGYQCVNEHCSPPTAENVVSEVLQDSCAECHAPMEGDVPGRGITPNLNTKAALLTTVNTNSDQSILPLVTPGNHKRSYLYHKVQGTHLEAPAYGMGEQMPLPLIPEEEPARLNIDQIEILKAWINSLAED